MLHYGRTGSFKVIEIGIPIESPHETFLVLYCNDVPIFYRFQDITIYWSKVYV